MATQKKDEDEVKYLGFVKAIVIQLIIWKLNMCEWVTERSGPLKIFIKTGQRFSLFLITPVYKRFNYIPHLLLLYFDKKVDKVIIKLEEMAPIFAKKLLIKLEPMGKKAIKIAKNLMQETITSSVTKAIKESINLLANPFDAASKGLSILSDASLLPTNLFKKSPTSSVIDALKTSMNFLPINPLDVASKGLSLLGDVPLLPTNLFKNSQTSDDGDATIITTSDESQTVNND